MTWTPREGQRVRSGEYGAEGVVTHVRGEACLVRIEGEQLTRVVGELLRRVCERRALGQRVEYGWALLASLGEAEADAKPVEVVWLCGDLEPLPEDRH